MELEGFQNDLSELLHLLHVADRPSVKEIIQADIQLILSKIESLEDICKNQYETNISWSRVAPLKLSESTRNETSDCFYLTSNRYSILDNIVDGDSGTPTEAVGLSLCKSTTNQVSKLKKNDCRKKQVENRVHKVLILGDSHARGCASEVKQKLKGDYEVIGFTNPELTMKEVKEAGKVKIAQLTKED